MIISEQVCKWKCNSCTKNVDAYVDDSNNLLHRYQPFAHIITTCPHCDYILIVRAEQDAR